MAQRANGPEGSTRSSLRHVSRPLGSTSAAQGYWEYLPPGYGTERRPLLVFFHGVGENGDGRAELSHVLRTGPPPLLIAEDRWPTERPFVVLSPQQSGDGCPRADEIHAFLTYAIASYAVDPARVYVTGLSCGAIGLWDYLAAHRGEQVAAAVLIAGDGRRAVARAGCALAALPIWAFHGDADTIVPPAGTSDAMAQLRSCDPSPSDARTTLYRDVGHDSWSRTYDLMAGHDVYEWMLRFTRSGERR